MTGVSEFPSMGATLFFGLTATALVLAGQPDMDFANPEVTMAETGYRSELPMVAFVLPVPWSLPPLLNDVALDKDKRLALGMPSTEEQAFAPLTLPPFDVTLERAAHPKLPPPTVQDFDQLVLREDARLVRDVPRMPDVLLDREPPKLEVSVPIVAPLPELFSENPAPLHLPEDQPLELAIPSASEPNQPREPEQLARLAPPDVSIQSETRPASSPKALISNSEAQASTADSLNLNQTDNPSAPPDRAISAKPAKAPAQRIHLVQNPAPKPKATQTSPFQQEPVLPELDLAARAHSPVLQHVRPLRPPPGTFGETLPETSSASRPARVTGDAVSLYNAPSRNTAPIARFEWGAYAVILEERGDWRRVTIEGRTGWMAAQFLKPTLR